MGYGTNPPYGWAGPEPVTFWAYNRLSATLLPGQVVAMDINKANAETLNNIIGSKSSSLAGTTSLGANIGQKKGIVMVCKRSLADNAYGEFTIRGICKVLVGATSGTPTPAMGDILAITTGHTYLDHVAAATLFVRSPGIVLETGTEIADATDASAILLDVMFDGITPHTTYALS